MSLVIVVLAALALRVHLAGQRHYPTYDGAYYLQITSSLLNEASPGLHSFPPGWPAIVAASASLASAPQPDALVVTAAYTNAILGTLSLVLTVWLFLVVLKRPWIALMAGCALALLPAHVELSISDLSEITYCCLLLASALAVVGARWKLVGVLLGASYLVRPEAIVPFVILLGMRVLRRDWRSAAELLVPWLVFYVPYGLYLSGVRGTPQWSSKQGHLIRAFAATDGVLDYAVLYLRNAVALGRHLVEVVGPGGFVLFLAGALLRRGLATIYLVTLLVYALFDFPMEARYLVPYLPFFMLPASLAMIDLAALGRRWLTVSVVVVVLAGVLHADLRGFMDFQIERERFPSLEMAGSWLRQRPGIDGTTVVAGRKPYVSFWASTRFERIPDDIELAELGRWCRDSEVEYLVAHVGLMLGALPQLAPLIDPDADSASFGLRLLKILSDPAVRGETALVYEVIPPKAAMETERR